MASFRVGQGIDIHAFEKDKSQATHVVLGGIKIPHTHGLVGHSDADAVTHAICDALLGALALGDIGQHFSDTDPQHANADSLVFLKHIAGLVKDKGWSISNIDTTVMTEKPMLSPHIMDMRKSLSQCLELNLDQVSIKATRAEKLGAIGRKEGLVAMANTLIYKV